MQSGSMLLVGNQKDVLGKVGFEGFEIGCKVYNETISAGASLRDIQIQDYCTPDTLYPLIMSPIKKDQRVFDLLFKYKPFDDVGTDIYVYMNSEPLRIVYNKQWVDRIVTFFSTPSQAVVAPSGLQVRNFTKSFEEKFQEKYQQQLETTLESRQNLSINVTIQAPQIIIPESVVSKEAVLIIADFGKLSIIKTLDIDQNQLENLIYSTFRINMNSLHLFTTSSGQWLLLDAANDDASSLQCDYIIHDFNVDFSVQVCTIEDLELPKIRIFANLPSLQLTVSTKLIKQLYLVLNSISTSVTPDNTITAPTTREHIRGHSNTTGPVTAPSGKELAQPANGTKAEVALSIHSLSLVLKQEDGSNLVKVSFERLGAHAVQRAFDIKFDIVLQYFYIEDCIQTENNEFKYLVTSNRNESQPLIKVSYYYIQKESPSYEYIDSLVYVNFNALHIMFNRNTVVQLIQFFNVVSSITSSASTPSIRPSVSNPGIKKSTSSLAIKQPQSKKSVTLKLTMNLQSIRLTLNKEGQKLGFCGIEDAVVVCSLKEKSMKVSGILGKLKFQDISVANKVHDIIIIQEGEDLIQFEYKTFDPEAKDYPNYGKSIQVQINTVRFLYLESFINSIQQYFNEISEMQQLVSSTTTYATGVVNELLTEQNKVDTSASIPVKSVNNIKFEVLASNPQVMVPCNASNTYILADFGQIYVINKFKLEDAEPTEEISVNVRQLNLQYLVVKSQTESNSLILENTDLTVAFLRPLYGSTSPIKVLYIYLFVILHSLVVN
jgi:vacuolar protein sorting-associated protein 13A/C